MAEIQTGVRGDVFEPEARIGQGGGAAQQGDAGGKERPAIHAMLTSPRRMA